MNLSALLPLVEESGALPPLDGIRALGVPDPAKPPVIAAIGRRHRAPVVVVTARPQRALNLADELRAWLGDGASVLLFPERDALPYERIQPDPLSVHERLRALHALAGATRAPLVVVASALALAQRTLAPDDMGRTVALRKGSRIALDAFLRELDALGYEFLAVADQPGQVARRGGVLDLFSPSAEEPYRVELWGDEVESIRSYDPGTQRSRAETPTAVIGPAREIILPRPEAVRLLRALRIDRSVEAGRRADEELRAISDGVRVDGDDFWTPFLAESTLLDHLPPTALLIVDEGADITVALDEQEAQSIEVREELERRGELPPGMPLPSLTSRELAQALERHPRRLSFARFATEDDGPDVRRVPFAQAPTFAGRLRAVASAAGEELRAGRHLVIVSQQAARLAELFQEEGVGTVLVRELGAPPADAAAAMVTGNLGAGWVLPGAALSLWTDAELFGFTKQKRLVRPGRGGREAFLAELSSGDLVVHVDHGIGRFTGTVRRVIEGQEKEYLEIRYAERDRLLVPVEQVDRVSRYVGPGDHTPTLTRLGSGEWARAKERVRRAVAETARELLELYARREVSPGYRFGEDTVWQQEMEAAFPYVETPDQLAAIRAVKADLERPRPMDRLLCGDVGFGKTEVAVRAAFKAVMEGRQVAVLAPTTVLAQQHFETFGDRLSTFPVKIEVLSRFRSRREQREVVKGLKEGTVDIVIGTHRLLQGDVAFKDLGLVIIDEEQRFGVEHKERLKRMRVEVDVLTLTATPIPRTLHMALTGIRDMSTIETPPENRLPIKTYVLEADDHVVREAILRELSRGGQIYFLHNRVESIRSVAAKIADLVPEATIGVGHGQLPEEQLERVMLDFSHGRLDVLVCTTIIESGIDIPNVNTIIINNADKLGLAQLYQLRGRVGRGAVRAYAYLLSQKGRALSEVAQKRLQAIFEAQELGAGFQIALRDLEIRGAGNLLGSEQSGHIAAVGFDLYARLLAESVERMRALQRGEQPGPSPSLEPPFTIDLPLSAHIPDAFVPDLNMRLALYQRIARFTDPAEAIDMRLELIDRFGKPPPAVDDLLLVARARALAKRARAEGIVTEPAEVVVRFGERGTPAPAGRLPRGVHRGPTQLRVERAGGEWQARLLQALELVQPAPEAVATA